MKFREITRSRASIRFLYRSLFGVLVAVLTSGAGMAQTFSASITGTVTDPSGAVVRGAKLQLQNMATKDTRVQTSGSNGEYNFTNLLPGNYQIKATAAGFKDYVRTNMILRANTSATVNVALQVGTAQQQVVVSSEAVLLDTQTANNSVTMDEAADSIAAEQHALNPLNFVYDVAGNHGIARHDEPLANVRPVRQHLWRQRRAHGGIGNSDRRRSFNRSGLGRPNGFADSGLGAGTAGRHEHLRRAIRTRRGRCGDPDHQGWEPTSTTEKCTTSC